MLIWAIFTAGFIVGGIITAFILDKRSDETTLEPVSYPKFNLLLNNHSPDEVHKKLLEVNHTPQVEEFNLNKSFRSVKIASLES